MGAYRSEQPFRLCLCPSHLPLHRGGFFHLIRLLRSHSPVCGARKNLRAFACSVFSTAAPKARSLLPPPAARRGRLSDVNGKHSTAPLRRENEKPAHDRNPHEANGVTSAFYSFSPRKRLSFPPFILYNEIVKSLSQSRTLVDFPLSKCIGTGRWCGRNPLRGFFRVERAEASGSLAAATDSKGIRPFSGAIIRHAERGFP